MAGTVNGIRHGSLWVCKVDTPTRGVMKGDVVRAIVRDGLVFYEFVADGRSSPGEHGSEWHGMFDPLKTCKHCQFIHNPDEPCRSCSRNRSPGNESTEDKYEVADHDPLKRAEMEGDS